MDGVMVLAAPAWGQGGTEGRLWLVGGARAQVLERVKNLLLLWEKERRMTPWQARFSSQQHPRIPQELP